MVHIMGNMAEGKGKKIRLSCRSDAIAGNIHYNMCNKTCYIEESLQLLKIPQNGGVVNVDILMLKTHFS